MGKEKKEKREYSKSEKIRRGAENVIICCLVIIVVLSGWKVYTILQDYNRQQNAYDDISETAQDGGFTGDIDFDALKKINPDTVAWIYYEGTFINYPIVKGEDNDKYLYTRFDGNTGGFGTLFVDAITEYPFNQFNTIVYGHHMRNGSMFGDLRKFKKAGFADEHPRMELITPDGKFHLDIWAFLNQPADSRIYTTNIHDADEKAEYIEMIKELAEFTTGVEVSPDDRLVELSTCAYEYQDARYIVVCKMVPWEKQTPI